MKISELRAQCIDKQTQRKKKNRLYYHFQRLNMTYETQNMVFHVMHVIVATLMLTNCYCERYPCNEWVFV